MKFKKSLLFGILGLGFCMPLLLLSTTSCSATPSPLNISYSIKVNDNVFNISSGSITCNPEILIGDKKYSGVPKLDDKDITTYQANAVFSIVNTFGGWIYNLSNMIAQLISRSPTTNGDSNLINIPTAVVNSGLDFALGAYLGSGNSTYRLGITGFEFTGNLINDVINNVGLPNNENINKPQEVQVNLDGVKVNFGWWRSDGGNNTSLISSSQFDQVSKLAFKNTKIEPKISYSLTFQNITLNVQPSFRQEGEKYPLTGGLNLIGYTFSGINNIDDFIKNVVYLNSAGQGDLKGIDFKKAVQNTNEGKEVNNNIQKIILSAN